MPVFHRRARKQPTKGARARRVHESGPQPVSLAWRPTRPKIRRALGAGWPAFFYPIRRPRCTCTGDDLSPEGFAVHVHLCRASPNALTKRRPEHTWPPASGFQLTNHLRPPSLRQLPTRRNSFFFTVLRTNLVLLLFCPGQVSLHGMIKIGE